MASGLTNLSPITVDGKDFPTPQLLRNMPMLHRFLEEVVKDWMRAVEPYQRQVDDASDDRALLLAGTGYAELQPLLLKCLFSYAFFFVATDNAYKHLYAELNRANNASGFNLNHDKPPKETPFVKKIRMIRNIAIAHFPAKPSKKVSSLDAFAAMFWEHMSLSLSEEGGRPDFEKLTFARGRFTAKDASGQRVESQDLEVPGMRTAHSHCLPYLNQYDKMCCDYLRALQAAMSHRGGVP